MVAQDSLDAGQALTDGSMVHINLEAARRLVTITQEMGKLSRLFGIFDFGLEEL
jgi:hypothetical protein